MWDGGVGDSDRSSDRGGSGSYNASRYVERMNSKSQSTPLHSHRRWAADDAAAVDLFPSSLLSRASSPPISVSSTLWTHLPPLLPDSTMMITL